MSQLGTSCQDPSVDATQRPDEEDRFTEIPEPAPHRHLAMLCVDASPGACTDVSSQDECAPLLGLLR